jgi:hypothetical protein
MPSRTKGKVEAAKRELIVHLPDTRGVTISRWGKGNTKLGMDGVYTFSRLPGRIGGTCPGATPECQDICYAMRVIKTPPVWDMWAKNSAFGRELENANDPLPPDAKIVRIHVSGDFDSANYVDEWYYLAKARPDVRFFGYTRSWRVPKLLGALEQLRALPNVQLFASMDKSMDELPPLGWRRAWLEDDPRATKRAIREPGPAGQNEGVYVAGLFDSDELDSSAYICPEETGRKANCQDCDYCIRGRHGDVIFLLH